MHRRTSPTDHSHLHAVFLLLLPRILAHGAIRFRGLRCPHQKEEMLAEMVAICWLWCVRLHARGRDPSAFPTTLASFAARSVASGRRLCGKERARDALSPVRLRRHRQVIASLHEAGHTDGSPLSQALIDNTQSPPDVQAAFRIDFPAWLHSQSERDRRVIQELMVGEPAREVARKHRLSAARVSQMRREFKESWDRFGEA